MQLGFKSGGIAVIAAAFCSTVSHAAVLDLSTLVHAATVETAGLYDNAGLTTWNGQPLSPTNRPSAFEDALTARWDFYVDPVERNQLYLVVSDVRDTNFGFINGPPFNLVALTGFEFSLGVDGAIAAFSTGHALPGQVLLGPTSGASVPLNTTPGWSLAAVSGPAGNPTYAIAADSVNYGFTHFPSVFGGTRIRGGGVFDFTYADGVDLLVQADFRSIAATAYNGNRNYVEAGTLVFAVAPVPEPATWTLLLASFMLAGHRVRAAGRFGRALVAGRDDRLRLGGFR